MAAIDQLLQILVERGASDLHLSEGSPAKMRLHGSITTIGDEILTPAMLDPMLEEICEGKGWETFVKRGDLDFAYEMDEYSRFRCNYLKQSYGAAAVFRLIPTKIATLEELGIPSVVKEFGHLRSGLVLVTGPTGSGKSTTLASLIDYININHSRHIITIEEPIEFVHDNKKSIVTQREVPLQAATFSDGLRATLRQDADIVMVGEMRDLETVSLALTAAETGLLVFGTLHTNNARKCVDRMVDVFPSDQQAQVRTMLAGSLQGVVAQLLCRRSDIEGRCAVCEVMVSTPAVGAIIREGSTQKLYDVITGGKSRGMIFMDEAIEEKLHAKMISPLEAYMKAIDKNRFKKYLSEDQKAIGHASGGGLDRGDS